MKMIKPNKNSKTNLEGQDGETPIISFDNVSKTYQKNVDALRNINLTINKGEFVFVIGPSGSGKSTLVKLLLKEIEPTSGSLYVEGRELSKLRPRQVAKYRRTLGVVFQDCRLLKDRNVYDNVAFAQRVINTSSSVIKRKVPVILSSMGLSNKNNSYPTELSGGEQQRVALARALVNNPLILIADEPTGNLDPYSSMEIMNLLNDINKRGNTLIVVTHNKEIVDIMQKRVVTLHNGKLVSDEQKGGYSHEF